MPVGATAVRLRGASLAGLALAASWTGRAAVAQDAPPTLYVSETRCGWFDNPTPGNATLRDRDGEWIVGMQGDHQAKGDWPVFRPVERVRRGSASYAYGCACLGGEFDRDGRTVVVISSSRTRPLSACRRDPVLAKVERSLK